jgi:hypothetical protein
LNEKKELMDKGDFLSAKSGFYENWL